MSHQRDWELEYDGAAPPVPRRIRRSVGRQNRWIQVIDDRLRPGAHLLCFEPKIAGERTVPSPKVFAGCLRIYKESGSGKIAWTGSGDLYSVSRRACEDLLRDLASEQLTEAQKLRRLQIRDGYRYYLRLETLWVTALEELILGFDTYRFDDERMGWQKRLPISLKLEPPAPESESEDESAGSKPPDHPVFNNQDTEIGRARLRWVSPSLRHAVLRIHDLLGTEAGAGGGCDRLPQEAARWRSMLADTGWQVELEAEPPAAPSAEMPADGAWRRRDLKKYQERVEGEASDGRWIYHLLVVDHIKTGENDTPSGLMYDLGDHHTRDLPREGAALAARKPRWWPLHLEHSTKAEEKELRCLPELFHRTAFHELGHMQGLYHNPSTRGLMRPLRYLDEVFDETRDLRHSKDDLRRLRHLPDRWVRPGGVPFGYRYRQSSVDVLDLLAPSENLELVLAPLSTRLGREPHELEFTLRNNSGRSVLCPGDSSVLPGRGRLGVRVRTPSKVWEEVLPVRFPEILESGTSQLLDGEEREYLVPWKTSLPELTGAGLYRLQIHLTWIVNDDSGPSPRAVPYWVTTEVELRVSVA